MDESLRHLNPNPMLWANFISKGFFCWLNPLLKQGRQRALEIGDMFQVTPQDSSEHLGATLEREWQKELKKKEESGSRTKPSLLKVLIRMFGFQYLMLGILVFVEEAIRVPQPVLLGGLIRFFATNSQVTQTEAYLYALGVSLSATVIAVVHQHHSFAVARMGMQIRVASCSLMYRKILRMSSAAKGQTTTGQIINLMSNDVNRAEESVAYLHYLWVGPLQVIAVLIVLWYVLDPLVLPGFAVLLLIIPIQVSMGKLFSKFRWKAAVLTDERVKMMNEIFAGMRVIKMYCWEAPFEEYVRKIRRQEMSHIRKTCYLEGINFMPYFFLPKLMMLFTLICFVGVGAAVTSVDIFVPIAVFHGFRGVLIFVPKALRYVAELFSVFQRLDKFLLSDELDKSQSFAVQNEPRPKPEDCGVTINNLTAKWDSEVEQNTLDQISASVKAGQLLVVIGPVGSGKSSLLLAILGELRASSGSVTVKGKVTYVSQQAWVFSGSLRQNVVFGFPYDKSRFDKVIKACAMQRDLEIMPHGERTLIGDRGVCLSGGQRARLSLARALYADADIFLLDDPLSAVDTDVGRHIYHKCIQGVLRNKPRILVTHQLQYLSAADSILILKEGRVECMGTYEELSNSSNDFAQLLKSKQRDDLVDLPVPAESNLRPPIIAKLCAQLSHYCESSTSTSFTPEPVHLTEEERQTGTVDWKMYVQYFKAGAGIVKLLLLVIVNVTAQIAYIMSDWWLSRWSNAEEERIVAIDTHRTLLSQGFSQTNITVPYIDRYCNLYIFTGIISAVLVLGMARVLLFCKVAMDASQTLHDNMLDKILHSPIGFFDANPVGRILNRFAKDIGQIEDNLPVTFLDCIHSILPIVGVVLVAGIVNPYVFIPIVPIVTFFFYIRNYYLSTSRSIKRFEGTCRSPVFSYLSASLQGLHTIRAFGKEDKCLAEFDANQNLHSEALFLFLSASRWLAVRLDSICALFVAVVTFGAVLSAGTLDAGLVGMSVTYAIMLMGMFQWGVRQSAQLENQMISVERVLEYSNLPSETSLESGGKRRPPDDWPGGGEIQANNLCLQYFPSAPMVLKNLTFSIKEKEKVGIVGRTGAGKSSLITCLFRLVEPSGHLSIDDIYILHLSLHDLRKVISIIPQDPVLFSGILRKNLDPFKRHADQQLWKALEEVQMKSAVTNLPFGLETSVIEGGGNFSVGQRQLLCLARAILCQNRILLIDEATANVDPKTDRLIQRTIRDKFRECTVLTIAHRLHTIIDCDRVMVLSDGCITEFDAPHVLLRRGSGMFYDMVQHTGKGEAKLLASMAEDSFTSRRHVNSHCGTESLEDPDRVLDIYLVGPTSSDDENLK